jgi:aerobic carbon-monoxide dehydrogenase small subunit
VGPEVTLSVNGREYSVELPYPEATLLQVLRQQIGLTGTKEGCGEGECGACTVLLDDVAVNSCLVLAQQAVGHTVTTIEGIGPDSLWRAVQEAFVQEGAVQCGYCTPGMVMSAVALLSCNPLPSREEIRAGMAGNLCRCTGYVKIVDAVAAAARALAVAEERQPWR